MLHLVAFGHISRQRVLDKMSGKLLLDLRFGALERDEENWRSGIVSSMSQANCFIILPIESSTVEPGTMVDVLPFFGLI